MGRNMVKAILLKPLDGRAIGSIEEFGEADFRRLVERSAVKAAAPVQNKAAPVPENKGAETTKRHPLDHDGDGRPGGSLKGKRRSKN